MICSQALLFMFTAYILRQFRQPSYLYSLSCLLSELRLTSTDPLYHHLQSFIKGHSEIYYIIFTHADGWTHFQLIHGWKPRNISLLLVQI